MRHIYSIHMFVLFINKLLIQLIMLQNNHATKSQQCFTKDAVNLNIAATYKMKLRLN